MNNHMFIFQHTSVGDDNYSRIKSGQLTCFYIIVINFKIFTRNVSETYFAPLLYE